MAAVWRAHDEVLARTVAIKILHEDLSRDPSTRERFRQEAVAAAKLVHPGIVSLFDTGVDRERVYLVIEYIEGQTLAELLQTEVMEPGEVARIGARVAAAIGHAHDRGIIHRDIKPANILLGEDGSVKVTDFGIPKAVRDSNHSGTRRVRGTAAYLAPEQLRDEDVDQRTDLYALGLVLYQSVTGQQAFAGGEFAGGPSARLSDGHLSDGHLSEWRLKTGPLHPRQLRADVPRGLDHVIASLTAPDPDDRPATATDVVEMLRPLQSGMVIPAALGTREPTEVDDGSIRSELRWLLPVGGLLVLAAALVGVGIAGGVINDDQMTSVLAELVAPATPVVAGNGDAAEQAEEQLTQFIPLTEIASFDPPPGDRSERDFYLRNAIDGAPATAWATERYNTPAFGGLKDGVGFTVALGGSRTLTQVVLDVPTGGFNVEIRVAGRADPDPAAWVTAAAIPNIRTGQTAYPLADNPQARFVLVWITGDLQPFESGFRAEIGELRVEALAS